MLANRTIVLVLALMCVSMGVGKIIYVDNSGQDKAGCGTENNQCQTIAYAAGQYEGEERLQFVLGDGTFAGDVAFDQPKQEIIFQSQSQDPTKCTLDCTDTLGTRDTACIAVYNGSLSVQLIGITAQDAKQSLIYSGPDTTVALSGCVISDTTIGNSVMALPYVVSSDGLAVVFTSLKITGNQMPLVHATSGTFLATTCTVQENYYSSPPPSRKRALFEGTMFSLTGAVSNSFSNVNISSNSGWDRIIGLERTDKQSSSILHFNKVQLSGNEASLAIVQAAGISFLADFCVFSDNMAASLITTIPLSIAPDDTTQLSITHSTFVHNPAILVRASMFGVVSCSFSDYDVTGEEVAAIQLFNPANAAIVDTTFSGNTGTSSNNARSAMLSIDGTKKRETPNFEFQIDILNCTFSNNKDIGGIVFFGPVTQGEMSAFINDTIFEGNSATNGAGIQVYSGEVDLTVSYSTFKKNSASKGGAIYCTAKDTPNSMITKLSLSGKVEFSKNDADDSDDVYVDSCSLSCSKDNKKYCNDDDSSSGTSPQEWLLITGLVLGGLLIMGIALVAAWGLYRARELRSREFEQL